MQQIISVSILADYMKMKSWMICMPYSTIIHRQIIKHILCRSVMLSLQTVVGICRHITWIDLDLQNFQSLQHKREKILDIVPVIENVDYENDLTCISFYAAECAEFPVMGEVHYDLTLPEALEAYEKIPSERMHGLKCVGFDLKDGSDYEGMQSLMIEGKIQKEFLNSIPGFRENSYVQNAISRVEKYLEERHPNVENPLKSNKKVDNEKNISEEKNEKELNIQMKPIPKKKRGK